MLRREGGYRATAKLRCEQRHSCRRKTKRSLSRGLCHRPALVVLTEPAADAMALEGSAEVVRPHLHPELFAQVAADLFGRGFVSEGFDSTKLCPAQPQDRFGR